jgi:hypothetical protein
MRVIKEKYVIATKDFPLLFDDGNGDYLDDIEETICYEDQEDAQSELDNFDEPADHQILKVKITYEL